MHIISTKSKRIGELAFSPDNRWLAIAEGFQTVSLDVAHVC